ncbi:MAG: hypothetical protein QOH69_1875, partial [Actinomycetota bacterium]|nr:hypothetical protein [Actinomycetota bacterium]
MTIQTPVALAPAQRALSVLGGD